MSSASTDPVLADEKELVTRVKGRELAEAWAIHPRALDMPDTLLSSGFIIDAVKTTGLISPFFVSSGRKSRLKKAAYEGRIGDRAYIFKDLNSPQRCFNRETDDFLLVPKNSIVFVECDLDFRLPDFIALRFNLQIQHVHRGLLLGTGPLIDPGFWGKLCIPLHNLTDADYKIPKDEGLIWIEFTKTTLPTNEHDPARPPHQGGNASERGKWDIEEFLNKAANQYYNHKVPIRSSLPTIFEEANKKVAKSADDAAGALKAAEGLRSLNTFALVAAAIALTSLIVSGINFVSGLSNRNEDIAVKLRGDTMATQHALEVHLSDVDRFGAMSTESRAALPSLRYQVESQRKEIVALEQQVVVLRSELTAVKQRVEPHDTITLSPKQWK